MRILPPSTRLPTQPLRRRHEPSLSTYRAYRSCLRWEFGFSCAFCLLHEADFIGSGLHSGVFVVEHFESRSRSPSLSNSYENLFYACGLCNRARGAKPVLDTVGRRILNPTEVAWSEHFRLEHDEIQPLPGDRDASYTVEVY